mgnify:CR=1 FL=1
MPKKPRRKLTEADQTELFEEIDGKAVLPAAEDEEPQEKKGKAKKPLRCWSLPMPKSPAP